MAIPIDQIEPSNEQEQALLTYSIQAANLLSGQFSIRGNLQMVDEYYMRENDFTRENLRSKAANLAGDKRKIADLTVPIIMAQVQAAMGYMTNVFLTGYPVFGVGADPEYADAALQMETLVANNAKRAGWARQLLLFFRDGLKYNLHGMECDWQQWTVANVELDAKSAGKSAVKQSIWKGNVLRRMDMYNTIFDPRVHPAEIHSKGEFAGYVEIYSRVALKQMINNLHGVIPTKTAVRALESQMPAATGNASIAPYSYYVPMINPTALMPVNAVGTFNWMAWALNAVNNKEAIKYNNAYQVLKLYCRIIPADFGFNVPARNTPQIWRIWFVNNQVVMLIEKLDNAHGFIPIFFGQPLEDGLDYQTKSFATNVTDLQDFSSAMLNGFVASKRKLIGDRVIYDPSRIREADINSPNPEAKIPIRPSAFGKPISEAVFAFPYRDENTQSMLQGAELGIRFANLANNQNPAQQGQFVKGNKTLHEYDDVQGHGNVGNQMMAIMTENQVFIPMKEAIKFNYLQYQPDVVLYNQEANQNVQIKKVDLITAATHFEVSDGLQPKDKILNTDELISFLQVLGSSPQVAGAYNIGEVIEYLMKSRSLDLKPFKKSQAQIAFEQQMQVWQQAFQEALAKGIAFSTPMPQIPQEMQQQAGPQPNPAKKIAVEAPVSNAA